MKVLVTGATGFIGFHVAKLLHEKGFHVRALSRDGSDTAPLMALGVEPVKGDLRDIDSLYNALKGCWQLYHLAADYRLWVPDPRTMYDINVQGTKNIMHAAMKLSVEKVIYTSTVGTLAASFGARPSNEMDRTGLHELAGHYKRSKFMAEKEVYGLIGKGLPAVILNPSTPVGPMDRKPTPTGKIIVDFVNGKIPAYLDTGLNFVDVEDVAAGHLLASQSGKTGHRYILGNRNLTLREFFELIAGITGRRPPRLKLPYLPVLIAAHVDEAVSRLTGRHPRIPLTGVRMAGKYMFFDSSKAVKELSFPQTPIEGAVERAVNWFEENGYIKKRSYV